MNIPSQLVDLITKIEAELRKADWPKYPEGLYEPCSYLLSLGGKRLRPVLTLAAAEIYGNAAHKVLSQALALEVFHNFTLMHDDIMDEAPLRRGKQTVHHKWNVNTAILSGDAMLIKSYMMLADGLSGSELKTVLNLFNKTAAEVCEGQQMDMNFETSDRVSTKDYLEMIRLKTAVLPAACLQTGAALSDADEKQQQLIYEFGINLGLAFQIKDDLLDAFGNPENTGKQLGGDILADKKTLPLLLAFERADKDQLQKLKSLMNGSRTDDSEKLREVLEIYEDLNIKAETEKIMSRYAGAAESSLSQISPVNPDVREALSELSKSLTERDR